MRHQTRIRLPHVKPVLFYPCQVIAPLEAICTFRSTSFPLLLLLKVRTRSRFPTLSLRVRNSVVQNLPDNQSSNKPTRDHTTSIDSVLVFATLVLITPLTCSVYRSFAINIVEGVSVFDAHRTRVWLYMEHYLLWSRCLRDFPSRLLYIRTRMLTSSSSVIFNHPLRNSGLTRISRCQH